MKIEGKLHAKFDTQQITDSFRKREFVVEYVDNPMYPQYVKFESIQDRTELVDQFNVGDMIEVSFNLKGREWTNPEGKKVYFTTLDAWRVQKAGQAADAPQGGGSEQPVYQMADVSAEDAADDLPF